MTDQSVTIVGCGYVGLRLARLCQESRIGVRAIVRSEQSRQSLKKLGIAATVADLDHPLNPVPETSKLHVYMVPPPGAGDTDPRIENWLNSLADPPTSLVYFSTTAVYGDRGGAIVSEESEPRPSSERGRRRLDAETRLLQFARNRGVRARILRVPGIYGPDRLPLERIAGGEPIPRPGETGPGNRIHVEDLAAVSMAALRYRGNYEIFNVGDGEYASMGEYFLRVAAIAGLDPPPQLPLADLLARVSPAMRGFLTESRRVDISRMQRELAFFPRYADLDEGIEASLP